MEKISTSSLTEGDQLEQALFLPTGQKLLEAGTLVKERHLQAIANLGEPELYLARSVRELASEGVLAQASQAKAEVGQQAERELLSAGGRVLVEEGQQIEQHHVDAMQEGAYTPSEQHRRRKHQHDRMVMADALVEQLQQEMEELELSVTPAERSIWADHTPSDDPWPSPEELRQRRESYVQRIREWYGRIEAGLTVEREPIDELVDQLLTDLLNHRRRFAQLALLCPRRADYLPDHACCVAVLAMATAAQLHWPAEQVRRMGTAALLYDVGMLLVPERIRIGGCELSEIDRNRVQRHPAFSVALLESVAELDALVKVAAFQHHERDNGMGYPCGMPADRISDHAKVLAICDVFAAATSPRSYHNPQLPYSVMEELVRSAATGIFDKGAMRALVQAAGLFPVGSYVTLSDRRQARVLASNPEQFDRPLVRLLGEDGEPTDQVIDLANCSPKQLSVARPAPEPGTTAPAA